jgi:single-stranded-DNA-specific exonuclease
VNRGVAEPDAARGFLDPSLDDLHDPACLPDVDRAVERLAGALERKERIFVHGDYDADGVTSAALCLRALSALGGDVVGLRPAAHRRLRPADRRRRAGAAAGARLILTADCGVGASRRSSTPRSGGWTWSSPTTTGPARAAPRRRRRQPVPDGCDAPFKHLCGAGVAFKVLDALVARVAPATPGVVSPQHGRSGRAGHRRRRHAR